MENHHVSWENSVFLWPCSMSFFVCLPVHFNLNVSSGVIKHGNEVYPGSLMDFPSSIDYWGNPIESHPSTNPLVNIQITNWKYPPFSSWVHQRTKWPFSIAMSNYISMERNLPFYSWLNQRFSNKKLYFYGHGFQFAKCKKLPGRVYPIRHGIPLDPQGYDEKYHPHPIPSPENLPFWCCFIGNTMMTSHIFGQQYRILIGFDIKLGEIPLTIGEFSRLVKYH